MDKVTLEMLEAAQLEIIGNVAHPCGGQSFHLEVSDLEAYCKDPEACYALMHGATKQEYLQWVETLGTPRCGALNKKGRRCGNFVSGGIQLELNDWLQEDGGFCAIHGGASSADARAARWGK